MSSISIQNLRQYKFIGIAIFDVLATYIVAIILSNILDYKNNTKKPYGALKIFALLIIIAIAVHYYMEIPTMFNYYLGLNTLEEVIKGRKSRGELS